VEQDTSPGQIAHYHRLLRAMTPAQKVAATVSLCSAVRTGALAGLRHRHPEATEAELRVRLAVRLYGRAEATRLFGEVPDDAI
jgi:hypothetical protein